MERTVNRGPTERIEENDVKIGQKLTESFWTVQGVRKNPTSFTMCI